MQVYTIASGSGGNCTLLCDGDTSILIDAGISAKRICAALTQLGKSPDELSGILITHEHTDHISGMKTFIKHHEVSVFAPRTVANHLCWSVAGVEDFITEIKIGCEQSINGFSVVPFRTPHDTPESVGYRISSGDTVFGFCTDCGHVTDEVLEAMRGVDAAVIEANHDLEMLRTGSYPVPLKRRILSDSGHLSNDCCGTLAFELVKSGAQQLILGHLSRENNTPALALGTVCDVLSREGINIKQDISIAVAPEKEIFELNVKGKCLC